MYTIVIQFVSQNFKLKHCQHGTSKNHFYLTVLKVKILQGSIDPLYHYTAMSRDEAHRCVYRINVNLVCRPCLRTLIRRECSRDVHKGSSLSCSFEQLLLHNCYSKQISNSTRMSLRAKLPTKPYGYWLRKLF